MTTFVCARGVGMAGAVAGIAFEREGAEAGTVGSEAGGGEGRADAAADAGANPGCFTYQLAIVSRMA